MLFITQNSPMANGRSVLSFLRMYVTTLGCSMKVLPHEIITNGNLSISMFPSNQSAVYTNLLRQSLGRMP